MKRKNIITGLLMAILLVLSASLLSSCGNDSDYTAKELIVSEDTSSLEVNFASFKGSVTVYCGYDGVEAEVMTIESDEDYSCR